MSALVTSEVYRLFVNTLTPHDKYSRRNMQLFWQQLQNDFISRRMDILSIFYCIFEMCLKFRTFLKKEEYPSLIITEIFASEWDIYLSV